MGLLDRIKSSKEKHSGYAVEHSGEKKQEDDFEPPIGPPPGYSNRGLTSNYPQQTKGDYSSLTTGEAEYAPPLGPPPTYHNWQSVPDTSLLPPPPALINNKSSGSNAEEFLAEKALDWERVNPPFAPENPHESFVTDVRSGNLFLRAPEHVKRGEVLSRNGPLSYVKTGKDSKDHCYISSLPLYFERVDSPFRTESTKTIYYEIKINSLGTLKDGTESSVAIGYCVGPYPTWRMPGWQRGSLAIHGDDGAKYMYNDAGGADFTTPFRAGETIGLGIRLSIPQLHLERTIDASGQPLTGEVFFTRNGRFAGGWNIQEGLDQKEAFRAQYLDGKWDLYAAVGTFGSVEISVNLAGRNFEFNPTSFTGI